MAIYMKSENSQFIKENDKSRVSLKGAVSWLKMPRNAWIKGEEAKILGA